MPCKPPKYAASSSVFAVDDLADHSAPPPVVMDALVLGTAGHVDHGKTALVHALTGIDTDRLAVEKARGITTELGFAHLDLGERRLAVVDVPGHERFIKSMVAGVAGIDMVMLVVAADEGVMPQTREHLDVCELLGVRDGLVAITKRDLVDDEWLAMLNQELTELLAASFLATAPRVAVSARTGSGMGALRAQLATQIAGVSARPDTGAFRLPIDRVFTLRGFGTVVTGTIASGRIAVGDELVVWPSQLATRARSMQVHGASVECARAGQRCALNLGGVTVEQLTRGDVLSHPGGIEPTHLIDVGLRHVAAAREPLPARSKVIVHHGATQVLATLVLVGSDHLLPGDEGFAQLRLPRETPLVAVAGDHFLIRGFRPLADHGTTLGGGSILRVHSRRARARHVELVQRFAHASGPERVALEIQASSAAAPTIGELARRLGSSLDSLASVLDELVRHRAVIRAGESDGAVYLHVDTVATLAGRLEELVAESMSGRDPRPANREEIRQKLAAQLPPRGFEAVVADCVRRGTIASDGEYLRRPEAATVPLLTPLETAIAARFVTWGLEPPRPRDVAAAMGLSPPEVATALERLLAQRILTKVKSDYYVDSTHLDQLERRLRDYLHSAGEIGPQAWKELTRTSRKYSIPLAEHFDAIKVTLRVGDLRRLRGGGSTGTQK